MTIERKYRDDWPLQILQRAPVVVDRVGINSCDACGYRMKQGHRDRYCRNCGRTLDWPKEG